MSDTESPATRTVPLAIEGRYLIMSDKVRLPPRCVKTNVPVQRDDYRQLELSPHRRRTLLTFLILGPMFALASMFKTRGSVRLQAALSPAVRWRYMLINLGGGLLILFATLGPIVLVALGVRSESLLVALLIATPLTVLVGIALVRTGPLRCVRTEGNRFWIDGCGQEFLTSLMDQWVDADAE